MIHRNKRSLLRAGWDSSDSDTWALASRGAWPPPDFPWWSTIAIAKRPRNSPPSAPRLHRTPKRWLKKSMWCCRAFRATLR